MFVIVFVLIVMVVPSAFPAIWPRNEKEIVINKITCRQYQMCYDNFIGLEIQFTHEENMREGERARE